mmetsp:Transcript_23889/g.25545  ORF Transcript_23889/g.25545 Transcript_23889/m.25545 type:complete len:232 (+) Transcript_23889:435-1130(+)
MKPKTPQRSSTTIPNRAVKPKKPLPRYVPSSAVKTPNRVVKPKQPSSRNVPRYVPSRAPKTVLVPPPKVKRSSSPGYQTVNKTPRSCTSPSPRSIDSTESECTIGSILRSPFVPVSPDSKKKIPICKNAFITKLHSTHGGCQVCIFKLSEDEKDQYENRGRHLRVSYTAGGCLDCVVFPSEDEEDHVRLCKQCFFDTHLIAARQEKAFKGNGALSGVQRTPSKKRYMKSGW